MKICEEEEMLRGKQALPQEWEWEWEYDFSYKSTHKPITNYHHFLQITKGATIFL